MGIRSNFNSKIVLYIEKKKIERMMEGTLLDFWSGGFKTSFCNLTASGPEARANWQMTHGFLEQLLERVDLPEK